MKYLSILFFIGISLLLLSCNNDDDQPITPVTLSENVEVYNGDLIEKGYVLAVQNGSKTSYLLNKEGFKVYE